MDIPVSYVQIQYVDWNGSVLAFFFRKDLSWSLFDQVKNQNLGKSYSNLIGGHPQMIPLNILWLSQWRTLFYLIQDIIQLLPKVLVLPKSSFFSGAARICSSCTAWISEQSGETCSQTEPFLGGLGGGFKYFLFSPLFGEDFQFD